MYKKLYTGEDKEVWGLWISLRRMKFWNELFDFSVSLRHRGDHPGFYFRMELFSVLFEFEISSSRHEDGSHVWEHRDVD